MLWYAKVLHGTEQNIIFVVIEGTTPNSNHEQNNHAKTDNEGKKKADIGGNNMNPYGPRKMFHAIMTHENNMLAVYIALLSIEALRKSALELNDCFCLSYSHVLFFLHCSHEYEGCNYRP